MSALVQGLDLALQSSLSKLQDQRTCGPFGKWGMMTEHELGDQLAPEWVKLSETEWGGVGTIV